MKKYFGKFFNEFNCKSKNYGNIKIKSREGKHKILKIIKFSLIVFISAALGTFLAAIVISSKYGQNSIDSFIAHNKQENQIVNKDELYYKSEVANIIKNVSQSVVTVVDNESDLEKAKEKNNISGFIIRSDGYIVTIYSKIKDFKQPYVKVPNKENNLFLANIVGYDENSDIAILKIEATDLLKAKLALNKSIDVGEKVIAMGNCLCDENIGIATSGIVTSKNKKVTITQKEENKCIYNVLETEALINEENNGGVLCNLDSEIIGLNTLHFKSKYNLGDLNYAISIDDINKAFEMIVTYGKIPEVFIGIKGEALDSLKDTEVQGIYVQDVAIGGGAYDAGIRPTDIILEVEGQEVKKVEDILQIIKNYSVGDKVNSRILREGIIQEVSITLKAFNS